MIIEGGSIAQITQPTAAMIVFGGTARRRHAAVPLSIFLAALKAVVKVFLHKSSDGEAILAQLVGFANKARRSGIVSLDADLASVNDPFLKQALMLAVDGTEPSELRKIMQLELDNKSEIEENIPAVFEAAGGFSPTVGIIGAVLGLIQVMKNLSNINEVGRGIAVAFVATIYGVGVANLFFLPAAGKLKFRHREEQMIKEMMLEGVISILEGMNPRMIETKLRTSLRLRTRQTPTSTARPAHEQEKTSRARQPRALARLLRRLHHPALRLLRRPLRLQPDPTRRSRPNSPPPCRRLHSHGHLRGPLKNPASTPARAITSIRRAHLPTDSHQQQQNRSTKPKSTHKNAYQTKPSRTHPPGTITMHTTQEGLVISLHEAGFFASGSPKSGPHRMLRTLAAALPPGLLRVEGHTDNVPIHTAQFASNWELSTTRATTIARLLLGHAPLIPPPLRRRLRRIPPCRLQRHRSRPSPTPPRRHHPAAAPNTFTITFFARCPSNSA